MSANNPVCAKAADIEVLTKKAKETYEAFFDQCVKQSGVDLAQNKDLSSRYYKVVKQIKDINKSIKFKKVIR